VTRRAAIVLAVCFCLSAFVYRRAPTAFLRAESGLYLRASHSDQAAQRDFRRKFFTESYGGHYTPLAFLAEFETAKWVGTHRAFWRWRQIVVLALVAAASFAALTSVTGIFEVGRSERIAIAAMLSAIAVFQPAMVDFVSWPFMVMQLLWLGLLMLALYSVAKLSVSPDERPWPWLAAAAAYASMHVSGLGFATVVAVNAVFSVVLLTSFKGRSPLLPATRNRIALALLSLACFAAAHGWAMIHLLRDHHTSADTRTVHSLAAVKLLLGFVFNFACAGLRSFGLTSPSTPNMLAIAFCWPLGVLLVAAIILGLCKALSSTTYDPLSPRLGQSLILIFSAAGFFALVSLVAAREIAEAPRSSGGFVPYFGAFIGTPRYLIPLHYLLLGPAAIVLTYLARSRRITTVACSAVVIAAVIAQLEFQRTPMRSVMPATRVSHYSAWRLVLATARQCRAAGLPMPNLPLGALTMEFADENIESFLPLLRHDLALRPDDKLDLIAWPLGAPENASRYAAIRPLKELERQLNLWPLHQN
jgi:hypothetical protein